MSGFLVVGDVILDEYVHGTCERISPEAPVPVVRLDGREYRLGGAANVARQVAALGEDVTLIGACGDDEAGEILRGLLGDADISYLLVTSKRTTRKTRIVVTGQQIARVDDEIVEPPTDPEDLLGAAAASAAGTVVVSDYTKGVVTADLLGALQRPRRRIVVDPKQPFSFYEGATVLTPNTTEALHLGDRWPDSLEALVVTDGPRGAWLTLRDEEPQHVPTRPRDVRDVVGAGDTFVAVLAIGLAKGLEWIPAIEWANAAAGVVVERPGTSAVTQEDLA